MFYTETELKHRLNVYWSRVVQILLQATANKTLVTCCNCVYVCVFKKDRITGRAVTVFILYADFVWCSAVDFDMLTVLRHVLAEWKVADTWYWWANRFGYWYKEGTNWNKFMWVFHNVINDDTCPKIWFYIRKTEIDGIYESRTIRLVSGNNIDNNIF